MVLNISELLKRIKFQYGFQTLLQSKVREAQKDVYYKPLLQETSNSCMKIWNSSSQWLDRKGNRNYYLTAMETIFLDDEKVLE